MRGVDIKQHHACDAAISALARSTHQLLFTDAPTLARHADRSIQRLAVQACLLKSFEHGTVRVKEKRVNILPKGAAEHNRFLKRWSEAISAADAFDIENGLGPAE